MLILLPFFAQAQAGARTPVMKNRLECLYLKENRA